MIFSSPQATSDREYIRQRVLRGISDDSGIQLSAFSTQVPGQYHHVTDPFRPVRIDINRPQVQRVLKHYLESPPPDLINQKFTTNKDGTFRPTREKLLTIGDIMKTGKPLTLDMWMHIEAILQTPPEGTQRFSDYPTFGTQLRELKKYMDEQQPRSLRKLWKDRRDTVGYVTLWAVIAMGGISILLALISIAVSSAQTVAAFESLRGSSP
jgi:hypothetical protein